MNENYLNSICYIFLVEDGDLTFFNKYNSTMLDKVSVLEKICSLPKDLPELFLDKEELISRRISGLFDGYKIKPLQDFSLVNDSQYDINVVFIRYLSDIEKIDRDVIFISESLPTEKNIKLFNIDDVDECILRSAVTDLIFSLDDEKTGYFKELKELCYKDKSQRFLELEDVYEKSLYTIANLLVLSSIRVRYSFEKEYFNYDLNFQNEIARRIFSLKHHVFENSKPPIMIRSLGFVVSDMSSNLEFMINKLKYSESTLVNEEGEDGRFIYSAIKLINQNKVTDDFSENKYFELYYKERLLLEYLIGIRSSNNLVVSLKFPISNSSIYSKLKDIGVVDRGGNKFKLNKLMLKLVDSFKNNTGDFSNYFDEEYSSNIKLVSDLPLEWSHHNGLPLMVRHEVSRIPVSPGNVATALLLDSEQVILKMDNFKKIKIISSFNDSDEIKNDLKNSVDYILNELNVSGSAMSWLCESNEITRGSDVGFSENENINVLVEWDNVNNFKELKESLTDSDSAITIFDLHGNHDEDGVGYIKLKDENVSVYDLIGNVNISPIIILSSCDTSPIDRNHYSTANAFFLAGAKTVLASALPILSKQSSIFIARLLLRVKEYLPQFLNGEGGNSIRWSSFVTGMIRRTYYTELLLLLLDKSFISEDDFAKILFHAGIHIDPLHSNWHDKILEKISEESGLSLDELNSMIKKYFLMPECLKYVQLGNPELIIIAANEKIPLAPIST